MPGQTTIEDAGVQLGPRVIDRPAIGYDDDAHAYTVDGEPVPGASSVAKIGADNFSPGAWWGWKLATEGVWQLPADAWDQLGSLEALRDQITGAGWTPNRKRDRAKDRGNAVHDALEALAQDGKVPRPEHYPEAERGHVRSLLRWYLHYRPEFEATEVIVGSRRHGFAGRYDLRVRIAGLGLGLVDLKTSGRVYPETHFPQVGGYELASVEMGYAATDFQAILRTSEDGSFVPHDADTDWRKTNMVLAWGDPQSVFLGYLAAYKARAELYDLDPLAIARREAAERRARQRAVILDLLAGVGELGATARELADNLGHELKTVQARLRTLKEEGLVECKGRTWRATC